MMKIEFATQEDYGYIASRDRHIVEKLIRTKIEQQEIMVIRDSNEIIGWMRFGYFWDKIPFMNMIFIDEPYRGQGIGQEVVLKWEEIMRQNGLQEVMTSTQSDEGAQHFYRKLGYRDIGGFVQEDDPFEILLLKKL